MPILDRNKHTVYKVKIQPVDKVSTLIRDTTWVGRRDAGGLTRFLSLLHQKRSFQLRRPFKSYLKEAKWLTDNYNWDELHEAMLKAAETSNHPWGFNYVRQFLGNDEV